MADDLAGIISGIFAVVILVIFLGAMGTMFAQLGDQKCQPYKDTISQRDTEIQGLKTQLTETGNQLSQCKTDYETLIKENITKKDIEEIKGYYNVTQIQISNLNQRFDQTNENYFNFYQVLLNNYRLSLTINIALGITLLGVEILSFFFLKSELVMFVIQSALKHRRKKKEEQNGKTGN